MKNTNPDQPTDPLSKILGDWKVTAPLPPRFQESVWQRIERAQIATGATANIWVVFATWIEKVLLRPAMAAAYLTVLLGAGGAVGWVQGLAG